MPCTRLDCTMAEIEEFSSVSRRTVEDSAPLSTTWPTTPLEEVTGMPDVTPEEVPLSMVTVSLQVSTEPEMMRAAVDWRLFTSRRSSSPWRRSAVWASSSSSATRALSCSFSVWSSVRVCWSAVRLVTTLPIPRNGDATVAPR